MTKTCQHCQTELSNARAKNCPTCSQVLSQANRYGTYSFVMEAIAQAKVDGLTGEAMQSAMQSAIEYGEAKRNEWQAEYRRQQAERQAEQSAAAARYAKTGRWTDDTRDEEDMDREAQQQAPVVRQDNDMELR